MSEYREKKVPGHERMNMGVAENGADPRAEGDAEAEAELPRLGGGNVGGRGVCTCQHAHIPTFR